MVWRGGRVVEIVSRAGGFLGEVGVGGEGGVEGYVGGFFPEDAFFFIG